MSFDPFWMFRFALSGDVTQRIAAPWFAPSLTVNYAGDAAVENRVVTEVASYGRQIGWLTEIALGLARNETPPADTMLCLTEAAAEIATIKRSLRGSPLDAAGAALDRLEREDPEVYGKLIRERRDKSPNW
jgi:hypothetical protein